MPRSNKIGQLLDSIGRSRTYDWFGGPRLGDADVAERKPITDLWPLRAGYTGTASDLPSKYMK
jgi:hypothetical protein